MATQTRADTSYLALPAGDIVQLAKNSFQGSFLPEAEKARWCAAVEAALAG